MADRIEARQGLSSMVMRLRAEAVAVHDMSVQCRQVRRAAAEGL
jgi:hypothetical protein